MDVHGAPALESLEKLRHMHLKSPHRTSYSLTITLHDLLRQHIGPEGFRSVALTKDRVHKIHGSDRCVVLLRTPAGICAAKEYAPQQLPVQVLTHSSDTFVEYQCTHVWSRALGVQAT